MGGRGVVWFGGLWGVLCGLDEVCYQLVLSVSLN